MAGFFRGLRDYGTTRLRDIAGDARVVSLARFPGVLSHSRAFPVLPSKSRALTSRAINLAHQSRAINLARPNYSHPTLASLPPRTTERTNKRTPRSLVRSFARSPVRSFARSPTHTQKKVKNLTKTLDNALLMLYICTINEGVSAHILPRGTSGSV